MVAEGDAGLLDRTDVSEMGSSRGQLGKQMCQSHYGLLGDAHLLQGIYR